MQRNDLTITIKKANLINKTNEQSMAVLLSESNLEWLESIVKKCNDARPDKILLALEDNQIVSSLKPSERNMLKAIENYLIDHFNRGADYVVIPELIQPAPQFLILPITNTAAPAIIDTVAAMATTATTPANPVIPNSNEAEVTDALQKVAAAATATLHADNTIEMSTSTPPNSPVIPRSSASSPAVILSATAVSKLSTLEDRAATFSADAELMEHIKTLFHLPIFTKKKRGAFFSSSNLPDGIEQMLALENPTLDDCDKIASKKYLQPALATLTRTETVDRFYGLITNLALNKINKETQKNILKEYVEQELILNFEHENTIQLMPGKITLSDKDKEMLCGIINLDPVKIPDLASGQLTIKAADAAPQATPRP